MCAPKDSTEKIEWLNISSKIKKAVEKARLSVGSYERIKFDKGTYRRVPYFTDVDSGFWNCG